MLSLRMYDSSIRTLVRLAKSVARSRPRTQTGWHARRLGLLPKYATTLKEALTIIQGYSEFRLSRYPSATSLIHAYSRGSDPETSLGPHWEQPGRSILDDHFLAIPYPDAVVPGKFRDFERVYFTGRFRGLRVKNCMLMTIRASHRRRTPPEPSFASTSDPAKDHDVGGPPLVPAIHLWMRKLYWNNPAFKDTCNFAHIKTHYYWSHTMVCCVLCV